MTWNLRMYTNVYKCINGYIHLYIHPTFIKNHHLQLNCAFSASWSARPWSSPEEINFWETFPPISLSPTIGRDGFPHLVQGWPYVAVYVEGPRSSTEHEDDLRHLWSVQVFLPAMRFVCAVYDAVSDVVESGGLWRFDFQIGSRVLKKVFRTFSYLYLWHTMWFHAKKLLKTLNR